MATEQRIDTPGHGRSAAGSGIHPLDPSTSADYIRHVRRETLKSLGVEPTAPATDPLPFGVYLEYRVDGIEPPVGLGEAYFHDQAFPDFASSPFADVPELLELCDFGQLCNMRTVYVPPEFRVRYPAYLYLCLAMAWLFRSQGARYATIGTATEDAGLQRLYRATGGIDLGDVPVAGSDIPCKVYAFELDRLLRHPRVPRVLAQLHVQPEEIAAIRARPRLG